MGIITGGTGGNDGACFVHRSGEKSGGGGVCVCGAGGRRHGPKQTKGDENEKHSIYFLFFIFVGAVPKLKHAVRRSICAHWRTGFSQGGVVVAHPGSRILSHDGLHSSQPRASCLIISMLNYVLSLNGPKSRSDI